ncbi:hypothetical protein BK133_04215 [Paenibacillus sp. FSL H8-0548]|uniref:ANTAR domain-containing response regulator n=1 Tax=Paenibacillus sp. FSL H8-0548 TaxID=1920422 RepID=UPI00096FAE37|nr:ANTAR domain-containing protein [Paenibacillus sp. FSL H8-0548]OMF37748.1 hypothetical protein BK133_04215 [Paenibacillus sp. FSL H8-0548]
MITRALYAYDIPTEECKVDDRLRELNYRLSSTDANLMANFKHIRFDIVVLDTPASRLKQWLSVANEHYNVPLLWWCQEWKPATQVPHSKVDGILCCGMNTSELQWGILLGIKNYQRRLHLEREYSFMVSKLEERKLLDHAKYIVSEKNNISESKAYEMMRQKAMQERKKIIEVAQSILTCSNDSIEEKKRGASKQQAAERRH